MEVAECHGTFIGLLALVVVALGVVSLVVAALLLAIFFRLRNRLMVVITVAASHRQHAG